MNSISSFSFGCVRGVRTRVHLASLEYPLALFAAQLCMQCLPQERRCLNEKVWSCIASHASASNRQVVQREWGNETSHSHQSRPRSQAAVLKKHVWAARCVNVNTISIHFPLCFQGALAALQKCILNTAYFQCRARCKMRFSLTVCLLNVKKTVYFHSCEKINLTAWRCINHSSTRLLV